MVQIKDIQIIDIDLIRYLKNKGMRREAEDLIRAYRKDVKKTGRQALNDIVRRDKLIKKNFGICVNCNRKVEKGKVRCSACIKSNRDSYKKRRMRKDGLEYSKFSNGDHI